MSEAIQTKRCYKCKKTKSLTEFYKRLSTKDGFDWCCKICKKKKIEEYSHTKRGKVVRKLYRQSEKGKAIHRDYQQSDQGRARDGQAAFRYNNTKKGKKSLAACSKRFRIRHPELIAAGKAVNKAVKVGILPHPNTLKCSCGNQAKHYHHHKGYAPEHWLDVIAVCVKCHKVAHNS